MSASSDDRASASADEARRLDVALTAIDWSIPPPGSEKDAVKVPSGRLARIAMGPPDGERVVLVPGMTGSKEDFTLMMPIFAAAGYRVEAFDMAGQYESHAAGPENLDPPGRHYTLSLFVDDLLAVLMSGRTPAHVLGYSFAGTVAAMAATQHPELFSTLTLLSAPPIPGQSLARFKKIGPVSHVVPGRALGPLVITALRRNVHGAPADRAVFVTARFALTRPGSVADILALMKRTPDVTLALRATGVPILVTSGSGDVWHVDMHRRFAARMGAEMVVLDTGHSPCETAPHQLSAAMLAFMRR